MKEFWEVIRQVGLMLWAKDQPGAALAIGRLLNDLALWRTVFYGRADSADRLERMVRAWADRQLLHVGEVLPVHNWPTVPVGERVVVVRDFGTAGMMIEQGNLAPRAIGAVGTVTGWVPGHGGDVVWVEHDHHPDVRPIVAAYSLAELLPATPYYEEVAAWRASVLGGLHSDLDHLQTDGMTLAEASSGWAR